MAKLPEEFLKRMKKILRNEEDFEKYLESLKERPRKSLRCNTLKIKPEKLKVRLENKGWKIEQPFKNTNPQYPEAMLIRNKIKTGEFGNCKEHQFGYYYSQGFESMMPIIALKPKPNEFFLDLTAAPGSKTTQACQEMKNKGTIVANEKIPNRIKALSSNLERIGCLNVIVTKHDSVQLCQKLKKIGMKFDKILIDPSCSGEGTFRSNKKGIESWNTNRIKTFAAEQKKLVASSIGLLKNNGHLLYSTCTHSPEENEEVVDFLLKKFEDLEIENIVIPLKSRQGIQEWKGEKFHEEINKSKRIYPHDNDTEGFFLAKIKKK